MCHHDALALSADTSGNLLAEYIYDSWGKVLHVLDANGAEITDSTNVALVNPLRYRGYYYDSELGLYYLNARYYDPETARFLNADDESSLLVGNKEILDYNLFSYCHNNPVNMTDREGKNPAILAALAEIGISIIKGALIGATVNIAQHLIVHGLILKKDVTWESIKEAAIEGAIWGAITGGLAPLIKMSGNTLIWLK